MSSQLDQRQMFQKIWNLAEPQEVADMKKSILFFLMLAACRSNSQKPDNVYRTADGRPLVDDKYSLQADRKELESLRAQVPEDKKRENDETAYILGLMSQTQRPPSEIRNQFDKALRKKRELFDKDIQKERETFTKDERKKRESFLKSQQDQRDVFNREKHARDEKNDFYKTLDEKRSEFFSVERDKRSDFESDVRERRKSFEDYARQKQDEFNQEMRSYSKRYEDLKKEKSASHSSSSVLNSQSPANSSMTSEAAELDRELQEIQARPGTPLESGQ